MKKLKLLFFAAVVILLNSSFAQHSISAVGFSTWGYVHANVIFLHTSQVEVKAVSDRIIGHEAYATAEFLITGGMANLYACTNDMVEKQTDSWFSTDPFIGGPVIEYELVSYGTGLAQLNIYGDY